MPYKHGTYAEYVPSSPAAVPEGVFALPVYIGTAPVNLTASPLVNVPVVLTSMADARAMLGYSDDWAKFTLCEAMKAHFDGGLGPVGPVIMINVFDPELHIDEEGSSSVTPVAKVAWIDKETVLLDTIAIDGKVLGTDFTAEYALKNGRYQVKITDKTVAGLGTVTVTYSTLDITAVEDADIVGAVESDETRTGLEAVDLIYSALDLIPLAIAAPGWSQMPDVYTAMVAKAAAISGKWRSIVAVDIDADTVTTRSAAKTWKTTNGYNSETAKVCWPMSAIGGKVYHLSTLAVVGMQRVNQGNQDVPFESASNKAVDSAGPVLADGTTVSMVETDANDLNAVGITTLNRVAGQWRLWGAHMGNYVYANEADILPEDMFDSTVCMRLYLGNTLQQSYLNAVDDPGNDRQIQSVVDSAQPWLNGLVAMGALRGADIAYDAAGSETVAGRFRYTVRYNDVPPMTALEFSVMRDGSLVAGR